MARFRRSGTNWEGRSWSTPTSVNALADAVEAKFPASAAADGTVASQGHDQNSPRSDHRPKPYGGTGIVRAIDIGENNEEGFGIAEAIRLSRDTRVKYVIHEGRMFSSYPKGSIPPYTWRSGAGHTNHVHVSTLAAADADGSAWNIGDGGDDDVETIKAIQKQCNAGGFKGANGQVLVVDGILGVNTQHAMDALAVAAAASSEPGPAGPKGDKGDKGTAGAKGSKGDPGVPGVDGAPVTLTVKADTTLP